MTLLFLFFSTKLICLVFYRHVKTYYRCQYGWSPNFHVSNWYIDTSRIPCASTENKPLSITIRHFFAALSIPLRTHIPPPLIVQKKIDRKKSTSSVILTFMKIQRDFILLYKNAYHKSHGKTENRLYHIFPRMLDPSESPPKTMVMVTREKKNNNMKISEVETRLRY